MAATKAGLDRQEVCAEIMYDCVCVMLGVAQVERFIESDDLRAFVWESYSDMVHKYNIHSIPLFVFQVRAFQHPRVCLHVSCILGSNTKRWSFPGQGSEAYR